MNRCITCAKIVTRPKAQNIIERGNHSYLVCCPMCEKEFERDPEYYMEVAHSVFGHYAITAHSHSSMASGENTSSSINVDPVNEVRIFQNLQDSFRAIQRQFRVLNTHLDKVSNADTSMNYGMHLKITRQ